MANINEMMDCLKKRAEESIDHYAKKTDWKQEDLEMACAAVKLYDKACDVQMKEGIWDEMKGDGGRSGYRYSMHMPEPHISYGRSYGDYSGYADRSSYARGRDATTGRYMSMAPETSYMWRDDRHSGHSVKDRMIWALEQQMDSAKTEYERDEIRQAIKQIEQMSR